MESTPMINSLSTLLAALTAQLLLDPTLKQCHTSTTMLISAICGTFFQELLDGLELTRSAAAAKTLMVLLIQQLSAQDIENFSKSLSLRKVSQIYDINIYDHILFS